MCTTSYAHAVVRHVVVCAAYGRSPGERHGGICEQTGSKASRWCMAPTRGVALGFIRRGELAGGDVQLRTSGGGLCSARVPYPTPNTRFKTDMTRMVPMQSEGLARPEVFFCFLCRHVWQGRRLQEAAFLRVMTGVDLPALDSSPCRCSGRPKGDYPRDAEATVRRPWRCHATGSRRFGKGLQSLFSGWG
jgi:hypothetical protein